MNRKYLAAGFGIIVLLAAVVLITGPPPLPPEDIEPPVFIPELTLYYGLDEVNNGDSVPVPTTYVDIESEAFFILQSSGNKTLNINHLELIGVERNRVHH